MSDNEHLRKMVREQAMDMGIPVDDEYVDAVADFVAKSSGAGEDEILFAPLRKREIPQNPLQRAIRILLNIPRKMRQLGTRMAGHYLFVWALNIISGEGDKNEEDRSD